MYKRLIFVLVFMSSLALLISCGDTTSRIQVALAPAPSLSLDYEAIKLLRFGWVDVEGETSYKLLEDEDGSGSFAEIATLPSDADSFALNAFLPGKVTAHYKLAACNEAGCSESEVVDVAADQLVGAVGYFKGSNTESGDAFGEAVALSANGTTLAVGASGEDSSATGIGGDQSDDTAAGSGAVYVFVRDADGGWSQQAYLKASNTGSGDRFGSALALSADGATLVVGASGESSSATGIGGHQYNDDAPFSGAVYVFVRNAAGAWSQQAYVKASNAEEYDGFGGALALSADGAILAVGADGESSDASGVDGDQTNNLSVSSGAVYVFVRDTAGWRQEAYIKASNTEAHDGFGRRIALSGEGSVLAVGARGEDSAASGVDGSESDNTLAESGAAYVFVRSVSGWHQEAYVKASNPGAYDYFGSGLSLSADGRILAVSANAEDGATTGIGTDPADDSLRDSGAVYVFVQGADGWSQRAYVKALNAGERDFLGDSLALSADGGTMAVWAGGEDGGATGIGGDPNDNTASNSGAVYVY